MHQQINHILSFSCLKESILKIIKNSTQVSINSNPTKKSGIYLLYVDNFDDDKILPIYIGQTVDFKARFKAHLNDVKSLLQHGYIEYHDNLFKSAIGINRAYENKYRPCKILKYIIDHDCSIDDIKMIIIEKCDKEHLDEKEQYYLSTYLPAFFGFNQIATITEQFAYRDNPQRKFSIIQKDCNCFQKYMEYGYSAFNYLHAFKGYDNPVLDKKVNILTSNNSWKAKETLLSDTISALKNYQKTYQESFTIIHDRFAEQIHNIFEKYKIKSKGRENDVLDVFTNHFYIDFFCNSNLNYLEYYFNRDKRSRECGISIKELYNLHSTEIYEITAPVKAALELYLMNRNRAIEQSEYSFLLPTKYF